MRNITVEVRHWEGNDGGFVGLGQWLSSTKVARRRGIDLGRELWTAPRFPTSHHVFAQRLRGIEFDMDRGALNHLDPFAPLRSVSAGDG